ncbi:MAG: hypothetical protein BWY87_01082 [Deltaproteobacteria bacterium ADurb.Bin510]|nr:MAG: hypothetical protein BWY87_01082 [Deltaproteobacteria bacterium ADurb.Bin510]
MARRDDCDQFRHGRPGLGNGVHHVALLALAHAAGHEDARVRWHQLGLEPVAPGHIHVSEAIQLEVAQHLGLRRPQSREARSILGRDGQHPGPGQDGSEQTPESGVGFKGPGCHAGIGENHRHSCIGGRQQQLWPDLGLGDQDQLRLEPANEAPHGAAQIKGQGRDLIDGPERGGDLAAGGGHAGHDDPELRPA